MWTRVDMSRRGRARGGVGWGRGPAEVVLRRASHTSPVSPVLNFTSLLLGPRSRGAEVLACRECRRRRGGRASAPRSLDSSSTSLGSARSQRAGDGFKRTPGFSQEGPLAPSSNRPQCRWRSSLRALLFPRASSLRPSGGPPQPPRGVRGREQRRPRLSSALSVVPTRKDLCAPWTLSAPLFAVKGRRS